MTVTINSHGGSAAFGPEGIGSQYRYWLERRLDDLFDKDFRVGFIMLNPSTADHRLNDPTIRRCIGYASRWEADALEIGNIFALRSTDPRKLYRHKDPVGPANDRVLVEMAKRCSFIVCGWGNHGTLNSRGALVKSMLLDAGADLRVLRLTKNGDPAHPLYLPANLEPVPWG